MSWSNIYSFLRKANIWGVIGTWDCKETFECIFLTCFLKSKEPEYFLWQSKQVNLFSPLCLLSCSLSFVDVMKYFEHIWHPKGFIPVWILTWFSYLSFRWNSLLHTSHWKCRGFSCVDRWVLSEVSVRNILPHKLHMKLLSKLWNLNLWLVRYIFLMNFLGHKSHWWVWSVFWWFLVECFLSEALVLNFLGQKSQRNGFGSKCIVFKWLTKSCFDWKLIWHDWQKWDEFWHMVKWLEILSNCLKLWEHKLQMKWLCFCTKYCGR